MKAPSPAFSCYPKDVLGDETCAAMTHEEFGMYWRLIFHAWLEGSIPAEPVRLARILKVRQQTFDRTWPAIAPCWKQSESEPGRLVQLRLEGERSKQRERSAVQSANGSRGGRPLKSTPAESHGLANGKPEKSLPSPSPSPSPEGLEEPQGESALLSASADGRPPLTVALIQHRDPVREVFDYWVEKTWTGKGTRPGLTEQRKRVLAVRLTEERTANPAGDPVEGLKRAVDGAVADPWYNGKSTGRKYQGFENIFEHEGRNRIEKLQRLALAPEVPVEQASGAAARTDTTAGRLLARLAVERKGEAAS